MDQKPICLNGFHSKNFLQSLLFRLYPLRAPIDLNPHWSARLPNHALNSLYTLPNDKKIKKALFSQKANKVPIVDGIISGFLQKIWNVTKSQIVGTIQYVFISKQVPQFLNETLLMLSPKIQSPKTINQLRPISLYTTSYKIISKVIVFRLRPFLDNIISLYQVAVILNR